MLSKNHFIPKMTLMLVAFLCVDINYAQGIKFKFDQLRENAKLSNLNISGILQDKMGFLWFSTDDGLNKYDGYSVTVFKHDDKDSTTLSSSRINCIWEDRDGNIWIGTDNGLNRYDIENERLTRYTSDPNDSTTIAHGYISAILEDHENNLWVAGYEGLSLFVEASES